MTIVHNLPNDILQGKIYQRLKLRENRITFGKSCEAAVFITSG